MENKIFKSRIPREITNLNMGKTSHGIYCNEYSTDLKRLVVRMVGPKLSPYEGHFFNVNITFSDHYPFHPPKIKFITQIFHPNVDNTGVICLDLLRLPPNGIYNPALTLETLLLSIQSLLANPNTEDPLDVEAATVYEKNREEFTRKVKEYVKKFCDPN